jgi:HPt (histidine-containing phosphotransfer) domain-containing protein
MNQEIGELRSMLGAERVIALLARFRLELEAAFTILDDTAGLRDRAHRTISQAGMLGFHHLSEAARHLEDALRNNVELSGAVAVVVELQGKVLSQIAVLLDELAHDPMDKTR